jgi:hypothetical protein
VNPQSVLTPAEYSNYHKVRTLAAWCIILGFVFAFCFFVAGVGALIGRGSEAIDSGYVPACVLLVAVGSAPVVGGIAVLRGDERWVVPAKATG